ncbi:MAG: hypothetical protein QXV69_02160 [Sulfolobaceae archaeon]
MRARTWGILAIIFLVLSIVAVIFGPYSIISTTRELLNTKPLRSILLPGNALNFSSYGNSQLLVLYNTSIGKPLKLIGIGQQGNINGKYLVVLVSGENSALYNNYSIPVTVDYSVAKGNITISGLLSLLSIVFIIITIVFIILALISWIRSRRR